MQWHQLDCIQTVCTSLQTDNHTNTSSLNFYRPDAQPPDTQPIASNHSVQQVHNKPNAYDKSTASCTTNRTNPTRAQTPLVRFVADLLYSSLQRWLSTDKVKCTTNVEQNKFTTTFTASYRPGGGETICPRPRRWQFDMRRIYVRPRTGPQFAHPWWLASCRQPACLYPRLGQTAGRTDGRIAVSLNAPVRRGHNKSTTNQPHLGMSMTC